MPQKILLRNKTSDINIFHQIFIALELNYPIKSNVRSILDCGANIGLASLFFKRKFPEARIIAVEPAADNLNILQRNLNGFSDIWVVAAGVYGKDCDLFIVDIGQRQDSYQLSKSKESGKIMGIIPCKTIATLIREYELNDIDLVKIDIEGAEKSVFLNDDIKWHDDLQYCFVEIHNTLHSSLSSLIVERLPKGTHIEQYGEYTILGLNRSRK